MVKEKEPANLKGKMEHRKNEAERHFKEEGEHGRKGHPVKAVESMIKGQISAHQYRQAKKQIEKYEEQDKKRGK